ncbi:MAG: NAD(P)H-dependent oxidoreductase [Methanoregulaceae archaeon]|nr:NAD(P)H-dependent oxidoreductase [Methanoregulaceae archaeon]
MSHILVILAHPAQGSFNHAIAGAVLTELSKNGYDHTFHDLYLENFPPVLPAGEIPADAPVPPLIGEHCRDLLAADGIVIVHPNWWGQPPAILTGWIDRVFRPRMAYRFVEGDSGEGVPSGLLKAGKAVVFNTSNTPPGREREVFGDPLERIWKDCVFGLCGIDEVLRRTFSVVVTSTHEERTKWLKEAGEIVGAVFPPQ